MARIFIKILLLATIISCSANKSILPIGFVGTLTGEYSNPGIMARNGFLLAIEEAQEIDPAFSKIQIQPHIVDDEYDGEKILEKITKLKKEKKIKGLIGPLTSSLAIAAAPVFDKVNGLKIPIISPTVATSVLSAKDDYFVTLNQNTELLAKHILAILSRRFTLDMPIAVIHDLANSGYATTLLSHLQQHGKDFKFNHIFSYGFNGVTEGIQPVLTPLLKRKPSFIILIANSYHAALLLQQFKKQHYHPQVFITQWTIEDEFLSMAGRSANGTLGLMQVNLDEAPNLSDFNQRFHFRFGVKPTYISLYSYEATKLLLNSLKSKEPMEKIINQNFSGLHGTIKLNKFGDTERDEKLIRINNQRMETIEEE